MIYILYRKINDRSIIKFQLIQLLSDRLSFSYNNTVQYLYTGNNSYIVSLRQQLIVFARDLSFHNYSYRSVRDALSITAIGENTLIRHFISPLARTNLRAFTIYDLSSNRQSMAAKSFEDFALINLLSIQSQNWLRRRESRTNRFYIASAIQLFLQQSPIRSSTQFASSAPLR